MNRKSTRSLIVALFGVLAILCLSACSDDPEQKSDQVVELEKRGFSDVSAETNGSEWGVYYVQAGDCRLKVEWSKKDGYVLVENSSQGSEFDLTVKEPSLIKLEQIAPLAYCFDTMVTLDDPFPAPPSN